MKLPNTEALWAALAELDLGSWRRELEVLTEARLTASAHGDMRIWHRAIEQMPAASEDPGMLRELLLRLAPWRKGPFEIGGVHIDAEWRSDRKWDRLADYIEPLAGRIVLDVGCGNGYYALRMGQLGARLIIGLDPTLLYVMQFVAVQLFMAAPNVHVLPCRVEELPLPARRFDTTFSMGVLYHQRSPLEHLQMLRQTLRPGGQLVLETLFLPGDEPFSRTPPARYARMRNVWMLPTIPELATWLARTGFAQVAVVDRSQTTRDEQRSTDWMPFESLASALDPADSDRTVEGWPAPRRVVIIATAP